MTRAWMLVVLVGCGRLGFDPTGETSEIDGGVEATDDFSDEDCPGALVAICSSMTNVIVLDQAFRTSDARCDPSVAGACVIAGSTITVLNTVTVTGDRPLILAASQTITVIGTLDLSSTGTALGAGGNDASCALSSGESSGSGAGGAAGGSFGTLGGAGGDGGTAGGFGKGAVAAPITTASVLRGGCAGGFGGDGGLKGGAVGGGGGGAVYLYAGAGIDVGGAILASGAGAEGTASDTDGCGGGGGGSGGMIALEAPVIAVTGSIVANGGGGGEGGGQGNFGIAGGKSTTFDLPASGGGGNASGGNGGRGAALGVIADAGAVGDDSTSGGGGGGGGLGVVWLKGSLAGTQISPAPTMK